MISDYHHLFQTYSTVGQGKNQIKRPDPETGIEVECDDAADSDEVEDWKKIAKPVEDKKWKQCTQLNESSQPPQVAQAKVGGEKRTKT